MCLWQKELQGIAACWVKNKIIEWQVLHDPETSFAKLWRSGGWRYRRVVLSLFHKLNYEDRHSYGLWAVNCAVLVSHPNNFLEKGPFFPSSQLSRVPSPDGSGDVHVQKMLRKHHNVPGPRTQDRRDDLTYSGYFPHLETFKCIRVLHGGQEKNATSMEFKILDILSHSNENFDESMADVRTLFIIHDP